MQGLTEEDEGSKSSDGGDSERSSSSSIPGADLATYPRYMLMQTWLVFLFKLHIQIFVQNGQMRGGGHQLNS